MTDVVAALGVPHSPFFPAIIESGTEEGETVAGIFAQLTRQLERARPDVLVFLLPDHFTDFFEFIPVFDVGVADTAVGPCDYPERGLRTIPIDATLARHLHGELVAAGYDASASREPRLDHSAVIPLQMLGTELEIPIVPIRISTFEPPLPTARRCFELGRTLRRALAASARPARAAVVATGSFSLDIGGPRMSDTSHASVPDPEWTDRVVALMRTGEFERLVAATTPEQLDDAGAEAGELLLWLAMLGTIDAAPPLLIETQAQYGHAFAGWGQPQGVAA
jgi:protocatechuate 4,5-dioxygenase beta chain